MHDRLYDWKNPANGPIRKPGSVQFLGLSGGSIEAAGKGAIDYMIAHGYPAEKILVGLPFYSSDNRSWFSGAGLWATNRLGFLNATDPDYREVLIDGAWWTTPDNLKQKLNVLLDERETVLAGGAIARGLGFWEIGHEDLDNPQLTDAIVAWRAGDRSLGGLASPPPINPLALVDTRATWRFLDTGLSPAAAWKSNTFNDGAWMSGLAPFGYGDGDEATLVGYGSVMTNKFITTWFRRAFTVASTASIHSLTLRLLRDDGAVVYLNGAEVFRSNLPTGAIHAATLALAAIGGAEEGTLFATAALDPARLRNGTNVVAVEIHQSAGASSDLSFELQLLAQTESARGSLIPAHASWRYLDAGTNPPAAWTARTFDDSGWPSGRGRLGYGLDGEWTTLQSGTNPAAKPVTCYFRHAFQIEDAAWFGPLHLSLQRDDGAVVYLNGVEILRTNLPAGPLTFTNLALTTISGADETNWLQTSLGTPALTNGLNVLAVEVHQAAANSSDLGFDLALAATLAPRLSITLSNTTHRLRWPAAVPGFRVQFNPALGNTNWLPHPGLPNLRGEEYELLVPEVAPRFYRLAAP